MPEYRSQKFNPKTWIFPEIAATVAAVALVATVMPEVKDFFVSTGKAISSGLETFGKALNILYQFGARDLFMSLSIVTNSIFLKVLDDLKKEYYNIRDYGLSDWLRRFFKS